jgi:hypothetical protein
MLFPQAALCVFAIKKSAPHMLRAAPFQYCFEFQEAENLVRRAVSSSAIWRLIWRLIG